MADLPDEMMVAYLDGELDPRGRAEVTARLAVSPELRERLAMFAATGRVIAASFDRPMREPVPEALLKTVLGAAPGTAPAPRQEAGVLARLAKMLSRLVPQAAAPGLALASIAGLVVGVAGGLAFSTTGSGAPPRGGGLLALDGQTIVAAGELSRSLESDTSAASLPVGKTGATVRPRLTFKSRDGDFCRQYEIAESATAGHSGIGCRDQAGVWRIRVHLPVALKAGSDARTVTASGAETPMPAIIEQLIEGDALSPTEESEAIRRKWRP